MKRILVWIAIPAAFLVAAIGCAFAIGWMLPVAHQVSKSETFPLTAPRLWDLSVATFHRTNDGSYSIIETKPPNRFITGITAKGLPFAGTWTYEFLPRAAETTLTITERGEVYNPFFRFVSRFIIGHEKSIDNYFAALRVSLRTDSSKGP